MKLNPQDLTRLYGHTFFIVETPEASSQTAPVDPIPETTVKNPEIATQTSPPVKPAASPGITWKLKQDSKVIFILRDVEMKDKSLTGLLKKIVESLQIPLDLVGFGILPPEPAAEDFGTMPAQFGVVFDFKVNPQAKNPADFEGKSIYFSYTLAELSENRDYKLALWEYLKTVKAQLSQS